ncbi:MAG: sialate O-acetylesterase [Tannerella sp.]|jgi:sialate O-acetylesterase|nr:sialate O-acetylesterase [Tannerella sp.]
MKLKIRLLVSILLSSFYACNILQAAELRFAPIFGEGMVLQRNQEVRFWGTGPESVNITVKIQGKTISTQSNAAGDWKTSLSDLTPGGPFVLELNAGTSTVSIANVYVGEVWIAGGQSNMQFTITQLSNGNEYAATATNPDVRYVTIPVMDYIGQEGSTNVLTWRSATGTLAKGMSAVAYAFARDLQEQLDVPVGVICCSRGGTLAEAWMSSTALAANPGISIIWNRYEALLDCWGMDKYDRLYQEYLAELADYIASGSTGPSPQQPMGPKHGNRPGGLYEVMLSRALPYTVKGAIFYQGEANIYRAEQYKKLFPALIANWRNDFQQPDMPFYFVQLSNHASGSNKNTYWTELQEAQLETWKTVPHTAMVVSLDYGDSLNIHPQPKEPIGKRLAGCARHLLYGETNLVYSGPVYKSSVIQGNQVEISFDHTGSGLKVAGNLKSFTICGEDKVFVPAQAIIQGDKIIVSSADVSQPVAVRYGWMNYTDANLFNEEGLPASPFRTDNFDLTSKGVEY